MAEKFGKTWWGEAWLRSLTHIDYVNRIPRGTKYARNGCVKEIKISGNVINAKVKGSKAQPYNIRIEIPRFSPAEAQAD